MKIDKKKEIESRLNLKKKDAVENSKTALTHTQKLIIDLKIMIKCCDR